MALAPFCGFGGTLCGILWLWGFGRLEATRDSSGLGDSLQNEPGE